jgi:hypothetical protein
MTGIIAISSLLAAWGVLGVLGGERQRQQMQVAAEAAKAEAEQAAALAAKSSH